MRWLLTIFLALGLQLSAESVENSPLRVGVSVLPLEPIVSEIGGDSVEVRSLQQEGDNCSVFEPRPSSIAYLSRAALFFRTGLGFETVIVGKLGSQFAQLDVVDLREAVEVVAAQHDHHHHDHGDHHGHTAACVAGSDDATDPHIWLDPLRVVEISDMVARHLAEALPEDADAIASRTAFLKARAIELHLQLESLLGPFGGRAFFIYHPALGYFADRYGLEQVAISPSGQAPTAKELHERIRQARELGVKVIFVQPQESRRHAEIIAKAVGAELVEIDPMARDWESSLMTIGKALADNFGSE